MWYPSIQTDSMKVEAICKWPVPTNVTEVRSFLGFTNYYQRFIKKYAQVAKPLYKLISGENASKKQNSIRWDPECQEAFDKLKELCTAIPILAYADFGKPFKLHTDGSVLGLRAVLYHIQDGVGKVISYASRSLTKPETKYLAHKLEFPCLKWAITEQFHEYLYGNTFDVCTDNNSLTYVLTTAKSDIMRHRWIAGLANYNFHIYYKSEKSNVEADALSRIDWEECDETIQADSIQAIVTAAITGQGNNHIKAIPCSPQTIESLLPSIPDYAPIVCKAITWLSRQIHLTHLETESFASEMESKLGDFSWLGDNKDPSFNLKCMTTSDWIQAQSKDKIVGDIIKMYKAKELQCHKGKETDNQEIRQFLKQRSKLFLRNGILYHKNDTQEIDHPDRNTMQLVLSVTFRTQALKGCHDDLGHLGVERSLDLLRD